VQILNQAGGNKRVYYTATKAGLEALRKARQLQEAIWKGIYKYTF
jgi:DNA-binding PadR family transcriptional regulator